MNLRIENLVNKRVKRGEVRMFFRIHHSFKNVTGGELAFKIGRLFWVYNGKAELNAKAFTHFFYLDVPTKSFWGAKSLKMILKVSPGLIQECEVSITDKFERLI